MAIRILPVIGPEDYGKFRALIPILPDRFADWKAAHIQTIREAMYSNEHFVEVVVCSNAFATFLQEQGAGGSTKTLEEFANEMATRKAASTVPTLIAPYRQSTRGRSARAM